MNTQQIKDEKENLKKTNPLTLIEYIKSSIDVLIDLKVDEKIEKLEQSKKTFDENDISGESESLLRKLESDIRNHIKMEHQLKLHSESLQQRIEDLEKENSDMVVKVKSLSDKNNIKKLESRDSEVTVLKNEVNNLKHILKSYEEQSVKISELEKKLRNQNTKHEKEMKRLEEKYKEKVKLFNKKLSTYEDMMKHNSSFKTVNIEEEEDKVNVI